MTNSLQAIEQTIESKPKGFLWLLPLVCPIIIAILWSSYPLYAFLTAFAIPVFLLCLVDFQLSLYVLVASWFFYYPLFPNSGIQIADFVIVVVILSYIARSAFTGTLDLKSTPLDLSVFLFLLTLALSLINANNLTIGLRNYFRHIQLFALFYVVANGVETSKVIKFLRFFLLLSILNSIYVIIPFLASGGNIRSFGVAHVPFANIVVAAIMICFSFYLYQEDTKGRIKFGFLFFVLLFALLATYTRSALLYFLLGFIFLTVITLARIKTHKHLAKSLVYATVVLLLTAGVIFPMFGSYAHGLSHKMNTALKSLDTIQIRMYLITLALRAFFHNPILGIGLAQFTVISSILPNIKFEPIYMSTLQGINAHDLTFSYLAETGILGLICLYYFIFLFLRLGWVSYKRSVKRENIAISLALLGAIIAGQWSFTSVNGMQFMFFLGLLVVWYRNLTPSSEPNDIHH